MFRLAVGTALVAGIYVHSPLRPGARSEPNLAALSRTASDHLGSVVMSSNLAPRLAEAAIRRTLSAAASAASGDADRSATLPRLHPPAGQAEPPAPDRTHDKP